MSLELILFIIFASICAVTSVLMITRKNPIFSALFLVVNFAALAGLYLLLNAQFIAVAQVIVYAGAIMVFFLFVIMLIRPEKEKNLFGMKRGIKFISIIIAVLIFVQIAFMVFISNPSAQHSGNISGSVNAGTVESIGRELFTNYVLPFEAAGFLLLAATIGALVLAKKKFK